MRLVMEIEYDYDYQTLKIVITIKSTISRKNAND